MRKKKSWIQQLLSFKQFDIQNNPTSKYGVIINLSKKTISLKSFIKINYGEVNKSTPADV